MRVALPGGSEEPQDPQRQGALPAPSAASRLRPDDPLRRELDVPPAPVVQDPLARPSLAPTSQPGPHGSRLHPDDPLFRELHPDPSAVQEREQKFLAAYRMALHTDPAVFAEAKTIGEQLGVKPELVERSIDVARRLVQEQAFRARDLQRRSPLLAKALGDFDFVRIARDDIDNLAATESTFGRAKMHFEAGQATNERGYLGIKKALGQWADDDEGRLLELRALAGDSGEGREFTAPAMRILGQMSGTVPASLGIGLATSAAATPVAGIVAGAATTFSLSGAIAAGNSYLDMLDRGIAPDVALPAAFGRGVVEGGLETLATLVAAAPFGKALGGAGKAAKGLTRATGGQAFRTFIKDYAATVGAEMGTEAAQDIAGRAIEDAAAALSPGAKPAPPLQVGATIREVGQGMSLLALPGPLLRFAGDSIRARAAAPTLRFWRDLGAAADASKVRTSNVGSHERFLAAVAKDANVESTHIDGQAFAEVLRQADAQTAGQGKLEVSWLERLERTIPGITKRITEAAARGEDVVIPTATVGSKIAGTEIYQALVPHMRLDANAMSLAEAEVFRQQEQASTAEAQRILTEEEAKGRAFRTSALEVEETIRQQLMAAGRPAEEAGAHAKLYRDLLIVKARQLGTTPGEVHAQRPLRVVPGEIDDAQALRQAEGGGVDPGTPGADNRDRDAEPERQPPLPGLAGGPAGGAGAEPTRAIRVLSGQPARGSFAARTEVVQRFARDIGLERVRTIAEAAEALSYLGRGAVEQMDALVTDAQGRPLAIIGGFKGDQTSTNIRTNTLVMEAFQIEGAANVWLAHNHPATSSELSTDDIKSLSAIRRAFAGSRIALRGLFAIGGKSVGPREWSFQTMSGDRPVTRRGVTRELRPEVQVPVIERVAADDGRMGGALTTPAEVRAFLQLQDLKQPGLLLLSPNREPMAFVPVTPSEVEHLRTNGRMDELYRAVAVAGASSAVVVKGVGVSEDGVVNLVQLLNSLKVATIDVADVTADGGIEMVSSRHASAKAWFEVIRDFGTGFRSGDRGFYRRRDFTIFLTKEQNASTFLHELGHHYLEMLGDLARDKAHPAILDDFRGLLQWFGVESVEAWHALPFKERERHHEAFARAFELWLWEGKAPSRDMEGIFARVARWLRAVYGTIVGEINAQYRAQFGVDLPALTDEVRGVFGRMLASEQDVEHAAAVQHLADTFTDQAQAGMDDAAWAEHQAVEAEARDEAVSDHTRDSLREMQWLSNARSKLLRELQQKHDAARARVREQVEAAVRREPIYRVRQWLDRGEIVDVDTGSTAKQTGVHKLQAEAAMALLPAGTDNKRLKGKRGIVADDGVLPDVAARIFGFPTGADLVREAVTAPPLDKVVDERTDARMLEEHGELADLKRRELAVMRALRGEARTRLIAVDLKHISKGLQPVRLLQQAAREQARRMLARQKVYQVSPRDHAVAEARATRAFTDALKAGDIPAAIEAQKRRLLQHEIVKQASQALNEIDEGVSDLARFGDTDERLGKVRDIDLVYAGRTLAMAFGIIPTDLNTQQRGLLAAAREKLRMDYPALATRVDALLDVPGVRSWRELPLETFRELVETGQALWSEAGKAKVLEHANRKREIEAVVAEAQAQLGSLAPRSLSAEADPGKTRGPLGRAVLKGWNVLANLKRFGHWAWFMDGGKLGWWHENFVGPLQAALGGYWKARKEVVEKLHPALMDLRRGSGALWDAEIAVPEADLPSADGTPRRLVLRGKKELVGLLLHSGNGSNLAKALVPYGLAPDPRFTDGYLDTWRWDRFLARMFDQGVLTQADVEFVRFVWGVYKDRLPADQATHKALYGFEFQTLELRPVHTPFGTLEGGYVPAYVDQDKVQAPRPSSVLETIAGEEQNVLYSISTGRGHTITRNPNYMKPLALDLSLQVQHMDSQLRFTHLQPAIAGILRILRNRDFVTALSAYDREALNTIILPMLDNAARQQSSRPSGMPLLDGVANWIRAGTSLAALGFNFVNALLQLTGFSAAAGAVPGRFMRAAVISVGKSPREAVDQAMGKSAWMQERLDQQSRILREDLQRVSKSASIDGWEGLSRGWRHAKQVGGRLAFWPQRMLQGTVDVVTWHAAYQQHWAQSRVDGSLTEAEIEAEAIAYADGVVKRTQGSANPEDLAAYEVGTPLMKLMVQFGSYSNVMLNQILGAQPGWGSKARAIGFALVLPAIGEATLRAFLVGVPDDDKDGERELEELAMLYVKSLARNATGLVPAVGPMLLGLAESDGQRMMASPAGSMLQTAWRGGAALVGGGGEDGLSGAEVRAIGTLLTIVTGLPVHPVSRAIGYDVDVARGRAEPSDTGDYLRGLLVGR